MTVPGKAEIEKVVSQLETTTRIYKNNNQRASEIFAWLHHPSYLESFESWYTEASLTEVVEIHSRIIRVLEDFFLSIEDVLTFHTYQQLLNYNNRIGYFYYLSEKGSARKIQDEIKRRSTRIENGNLVFIDKSDAYKYFLLLSPFSESDTTELISFMNVKMSPLFRLTVHFLTHRITSSSLVYSNKVRLIKHFNKKEFKIPENFQLTNIHLLWAMGSFMEGRINHGLKIKLNQLLTQWVLKKIGTSTPKVTSFPLSFRQKPKILILAEHMQLEHVMYRCFSIPLSHLREYFHVIAYTAEEDKGKGKWEWSDELVTFSLTSFTLNIEIDRIQKLAPDVIVYPSIGLKIWGLLLSRLRLAPLQVSLLGHPDFPYSEEIDYVVGGNTLIKNENAKHIRLKNTPGSLFSLLNDGVFPKYCIRENTDVVKVAVCANIFKLTPQLMEACVEIKNRAKKQIEFHFFQNLKGIHYQLGRKQILDRLGEAHKVYPAVTSREYYQLLGSCDIYLSPFPFGGENSLLDALIMRLPVVALAGNEPRERLDLRVLKTLGMEGMAALSMKEYISKALILIEKDQTRIAESKKLAELDISSVFRKEANECSHELAEKIYELYQEKINS